MTQEHQEIYDEMEQVIGECVTIKTLERAFLLTLKKITLQDKKNDSLELDIKVLKKTQERMKQLSIIQNKEVSEYCEMDLDNDMEEIKMWVTINIVMNGMIVIGTTPSKPKFNISLN